MKAIILAAVACLVAFVLATCLFHLSRIVRRANALLWVFAVGLIFLITSSVATPDDLTFLPNRLMAEPRWFDLASSVFFFTAAFFGGVLQLYNLADRGLSLRILIDLLEQADQQGTVESMFEGYSQGKGMHWMYDKRIEGMVRNHLISFERNGFVLTTSGRRTAKVYAWLRRVLNVDAE
jgi:hypothetical protein